MSQRMPTVWRLVGLAAVCGCTVDAEMDGYVKVSGRVTYHGRPVKKGTVNFLPVRDGGVSATGEIDDGDIKNVTTHEPGDGAMEGEYKVTIIAFDPADAEQRWDRYNGPSPAEVARLVADAKVLIPLRYGSVAGSDLTAHVSAHSRTFEFDLKD